MTRLAPEPSSASIQVSVRGDAFRVNPYPATDRHEAFVTVEVGVTSLFFSDAAVVDALIGALQQARAHLAGVSA